MFEFNTREYEFTHGRAPKGRGAWAFRVRGELGGEVLFSPSMTYGEAKAWVKNRLRLLVPADYAGHVEIVVEG